MEEQEIPLEQVQEQVEHVHHDGGDHGGRAGWVTWAALLSAILAVLAAVSALHAGAKVNHAMMDQMKAANQWNYYQAKGIKATVLETRIAVLTALGKEVPDANREKLAKYGEEQKDIQEKAAGFEEEGQLNFEQHEIFSKAVTMFQIAIAVTAIAVLAKKRRFLFVSSVFGIIGIFFMVQGFLFGLHGH